MLSFIHAADLHLDTPFASLPPELAAQRRREQREIPARIAQLALARRADLVLLAGDLFDGETVFTETVEALMAALGRIPAPVLISPGNHDFFSSRSPYALRWPENVHIFKSGAVERICLPRLRCAVYGAAFTAPERGQSFLDGFGPETDGGLARLMVLHGEVGAAEARYDPIAEEQIAASGLAYLALGHVHGFSGVRRAGDTVWAWPGCPEGRGFDETGPKGVIAGTVDDAGHVGAEFVPLCRRRYEIRTADLSAVAEPADAIRSLLPELSESDIYRIVLTGETGAQGPDLATLLSLLEGKVFHAQLRDQTRVRRDIWARAGEDTLTGLFLREMRRKLDAAAEEEARAEAELAVRFGLAALENREDPVRAG